MAGAQGSKLKPTELNKLQNQMKAWREELLSLDRRQKLIYFQHPKTGSFEFIDPSLDEIESLIDAGNVHLATGEPDPEPEPDALVQPADALGLPVYPLGSRIVTVKGKTNQQILAACKRLHQRSEQEFADRGVWILYVALGMLNWTDPADQKPVTSPLLLIPVRLVKEGTRYVLNRTEDEPVVNSALALKMSRDFAIEMPVFDDADFTSAEVIARTEEAIAGEPSWSIDRRSVLMTFSFHKEAMYRDLEINEDRILASDLIQLMALGPDAPNAGSFAYEPPSDDQLDAAMAPETLHSILDADGSQRKCIIAARDGKSFIMDGPPGTGKSQTIANIIAELIAVGKTVLFVSEKAAALDVVRDRLSSRNLNPFLLELHSHKATRKQVVESLHTELTQKPFATNKFDATDKAQLVSSREMLSAYADAMNEVRYPLGRTLQEVLGRLMQLQKFEKYRSGDREHFETLSAEQLGDVQQHGVAFSKAWRPVEERDDFLWRGLEGDILTAQEIKHVISLSEQLAGIATALVSSSQQVDIQLPFLELSYSIEDVAKRALIVEVLGRRRAVPDLWWTSQDLVQIEGRRNDLRAEAESFKSLSSQVSSIFGNKWQLADQSHFEIIEGLSVEQPEIPLLTPMMENTVTGLEVAVSSLIQLLAMLRELLPVAKRLAEVFQVDVTTLSLAKVKALTSLAELSQSGTLPERSWLNPNIQAALDESARVLEEFAAIALQREAALQSVYTSAALSLDLGSIHLRFQNHHKGLKKWSKQAREDRRSLRAVTVSGTVTKESVSRLGEGVAWQAAQNALLAKEAEFGPRLESYYHGAQTDFGRLREAIDVAREAVRLAGQDVSPLALAAQLSRGGTPDFALLPVSRDVEERLKSVSGLIGTTFNKNFASWAQLVPLDGLLERLEMFESRLEEAAATRLRLSELGASDRTLRHVGDGLRQICELAKLESSMLSRSAADEGLFGPHYNAFDTNWAALDADLAWCSETRSEFRGPLVPDAIRYIEEFEQPAEHLGSSLKEWADVSERLFLHFEQPRTSELRDDFDGDLEVAVEAASAMAASAAADIDVWFEFKRLRRWATQNGLAGVLDDLAGHNVPAEDVCEALEHAALEPWVEGILASEPRLESYRAANREALVKEYRALDQKLITSAYSSVVNACTARRPRSNAGPAAVITHEANKKSRHKPIRRLLEEAGDIAQALKPCFMMSPLSVSQYLPASIRFDVVIFDEASQVMPADAVNCIYRGDQLIVAGDQKQLPPTSFFSSADVETDDEGVPDAFDSVLDLCKASGSMPSIPLTWHYRSLHEDLITYSNYRFYEGKLNTFPGATQIAADLGVHHEYVAGEYKRGGGAKNPVEADKVVDRILEHRKSNSGYSLGVVTFSTVQADAISEAIERRADAEPLLAGLMDDHDRLHGFFVKNLESVQGDERDIIIFSVGYGPDEFGKFTMNFGPLTRKGGQRRLNVAITRARRRVEIVSSFMPSQMVDGSSEGNRHLKNYLDFAVRGRAALSEDMPGSIGEIESPFEEEVVRLIRSWGYDAVPQVGAAGYRIDIGVRHPDYPGTYMLGVECDGAAYHSAKTARDRDRLRESVLRGLGWRIHRIWGISWYRDRGSQEELLRQALDNAIRPESSTPAESILSGDGDAPELDFQPVDLAAAPSWALPYAKAESSRRAYWSDPGSRDTVPELVRFCERVVAVEAPLHLDTLYRRLRESWGIGSIGSRIRENVRIALSMTKINGSKVTVDAEKFIRLGSPSAVIVRKPDEFDEPRKAGVIPPEEFDQAIQLVLADSVAASEEQLRLAVRNIFGWNRQGADIQAAMQRALFRVVKSGKCERSEDGTYRLMPVS